MDADASNSAVPLGAVLGSYRIERLLGRGGMGAVFLAYDTTLQRRVALKIVEALDDGDTARARVLREARNAAALNHPHICTIHEVGRADGVDFIAMEYVEGRSLRECLLAGALPLNEVLALATQAADALTYAHEHGVVHRDFKAANTILTDDGRLKIVDFGLARRTDALMAGETTRASIVTAGSAVGTPYAMAPEQVRGEPADARSDVWALGVLLYEMVMGRQPFIGATLPDLFSSILTGTPAALPRTLPAAFRALVDKALDKDPQARYQSMRELAVDLRRVARQTETTSADATRSPRRLRRWIVAASGAMLLAAAVSGIWLWIRPAARPPSISEWTPLTSFPDSVSQPALSADGRMLAFVRGPGSFLTPGQIYVKMLPDGEPKPLTNDRLSKMSPVFSPNGSTIAYTVDPWDTWTVPVLGGEPRQWLPNASGLVWAGSRTILFSEIFDRLEGNHMKIVASEESRADARDLYVPSAKGAMAHRSYPSPDDRWAMLAEMDNRGVWLPCRLVPMDGSSEGRPIGPPRAPCWFAAWSPDGRWMYLNSKAGGTFDIWRQRFAERGELAAPEQMTFGPTDEEGITMAPDGRSLITAVGTEQRSVWVHDAQGDRQVSLEGRASHPKFSPDGKTLFYVLEKGRGPELWIADLVSGRTEALLPGLAILDNLAEPYDVSPDGRHVAVQALDSEGTPRIWLAAVDRRSPPRPIPTVEGDGPVFAPNGEILFWAREGTYGFAYRVKPDGTGLRKATDHPVIQTRAVSRDGQWLVAYARYTPPNAEPRAATMALPLAGGPGVRLFGPSESPVKWSFDGRTVFLALSSSAYSGQVGRTYVVPLPPGQVWPAIPEGGFLNDEDIARLPGVRVIEVPDAAPGPTADIYAYSRGTAHRNLYRIPLP
ncbi:MAG: protein kinase domain-containing protein [Acidobacteriota bacterium]